jgi:hypothetical protein
MTDYDRLTTKDLPIRLHIATQIAGALTMGGRPHHEDLYTYATSALNLTDALLEAYDESKAEGRIQGSIMGKYTAGHPYGREELAYIEDNPGWWMRVQDGEITS